MTGDLLNDLSLSTKSNLNQKTDSEFDKNLDENSYSKIFSNLELKMKNNKVQLKCSNSHYVKGKWSKEEDEKLNNAIGFFGPKNWKNIAQFVKGRSPVQCLHRWSKILQPGLVKGPWSIEEDRILLDWVIKEGPTEWSSCAQFINGRSGKQCRERYYNILVPNLKKGDWTSEEDFILFKLFNQYGSKWSKITKFFKGRTENSVKNRFYSTLRRIANEKKKNKGVENSNSSKIKDMSELISDAINQNTFKLLERKRSKNCELPYQINCMDDILNTEIEEFLKNNPKNKKETLNQILLNDEYKLNSTLNNDNFILENDNFFPNYQDENNFFLSMPIKSLENRIEEFDINKIINTNLINLDVDTLTNKLCKFNDSKLPKLIIESEGNYIKNVQMEDNSALISLLKQINEIEEILTETKSDLIKKIDSSL